jgi:MFS superfamily sulfate permease-like transporter
VLVKAAFSLVDLQALRVILNIDRPEFALSVLATLGVVAVGAINAILIVVVLAILRFVKLVSRPKVEILGEVEGFPGFHSTERHPGSGTIPGVILFRFNSPIVFFNAPYFKRAVMAAVEDAGPSLKWLVLDLLPITMVDATGLYTAEEVADSLHERGVVLAAAGRQTEWHIWAERHRAPEGRKIAIYPTMDEAIRTFRRTETIETDIGNPN